MKVQEIQDCIAGEAKAPGDPAAEIQNAYTSDLLSDVMGNAPANSVLITVQGHKNTVAVANLVGMPAIILCNGRGVPQDMQESAEQEGIALYTTKFDQFTASYKIAQALGKV
ncbi:MAG: iron-sulfur binding hydrogenase [Spirochaetia bacterium]|nr:iron-sulfur binding hydrogenase [Spirochaetia bacterium]